jgi:hypothetical protein
VPRALIVRLLSAAALASASAGAPTRLPTRPYEAPEALSRSRFQLYLIDAHDGLHRFELYGAHFTLVRTTRSTDSAIEALYAIDDAGTSTSSTGDELLPCTIVRIRSTLVTRADGKRVGHFTQYGRALSHVADDDSALPCDKRESSSTVGVTVRRASVQSR